jgi:hypothetical protein
VKLRGALDVAVCSLRVDGNGQVDQLEVLEAPNSDVAAILRRCVAGWRFRPASVGAVSGKLTFYFSVVGGKVVVEAPVAPGPAPGAAPDVNGRGRLLKPATDTRIVSESELASLGAGAVVDVRDRHGFARRSRAKTVNIPIDELPVRAHRELAARQPVVIDCSFTEQTLCMSAASILKYVGIQQVFVLSER